MSLIRRLESCTLERIEVMRGIVVEEMTEIDKQLSKCESEFNDLAQKSYTVKLDKKHGHYELTLDKIESRIARLNTQKEELLDKARVIDEVWQKKHLKEAQAKIFGSNKMVVAKDSIIFVLILFVITILAIDLLGIGATGGGAVRVRAGVRVRARAKTRVRVRIRATTRVSSWRCGRRRLELGVMTR